MINKFAAVMHPHELGLQTGYIVINAPPAESKAIAKKLASYSEVQDVFRTFDGKVITRVVVSNRGNNTGFEEFLTKLDNCNFTAYPVHDVVKYETGIQTDMLKTLEIYEDK